MLDIVDDSRLKINQKGAGNIMVIIGLVEENILSVISLCRIFLKNTFGADSVFLT
jgi:hypothetical protein